MAHFLLTQFGATPLSNAARKQVAMYETRDVITRIGILDNGAKFDADGTTTMADVALGKIIARFQVTSDTTGLRTLNSNLRALELLAGFRATLTGTEQSDNGTTFSYTCTARCVKADTEDYNVGSGPPMVYTFKQRSFVTLTWEKLTEWVAA